MKMNKLLILKIGTLVLAGVMLFSAFYSALYGVGNGFGFAMVILSFAFGRYAFKLREYRNKG